MNFPGQSFSVFIWLAPFRGGLYYDHQALMPYLTALAPWLPFDVKQEDIFHEVVRLGVRKGWLQLIAGDYALMRINPIWGLELRQTALRQLPDEFLTASLSAYIAHYREMAEQLLRLDMRGDQLARAEAAEILTIEWLNIQGALRLLVVDGQDDDFLSTALRRYFQASGQSARWLPEALNLLQYSEVKTGNVANRIDRLDDVGTTLLGLYRPEEARIYVEEAWRLCDQLESGETGTAIRRSALCNSLSICSTTFWEQKQWLEKAIQIVQEAGLDRQVVRYSYNLSELLLEQGRYTESLELLNGILPMARKGKPPDMLVPILLSLASHARSENRFRTARQNLREALRLVLEPAKEAEIRQDLAGVYFEEGKMVQAKRQVQRALPVFLQHNNERQAGNAWSLLSVIAFSEGNYAEGIEYAERALQCFAETEQWGLMGQTYGNIAILCHEQEWWEDCIDYARRANEQYKRADNRLQAARQELLEGAGLLGLGYVDKARNLYVRAKSVFEEEGNTIEIANARALEVAIDKMQNTKDSAT
ncbi:MAG: hypothetical protein KDD14_07345 [Saprospiraceae bacterium]|nr:hypothetical protein [Saprospiraceae bacterium]